MEQRCSIRKPLMLDTILDCPGLGMVSAKTRDIGLGGMYIETGRIQIPFYVALGVSVVLDGQGWQPLRMNGIVVRSDEMGVGLQFSELDYGIKETLQILVCGTSGLEDEHIPVVTIH